MPPGVVTVTGAEPEAALGTAATMVPPFVTVNMAVVFPNFTALAEARSFPVIVTVEPMAPRPEESLSDVGPVRPLVTVMPDATFTVPFGVVS